MSKWMETQEACVLQSCSIPSDVVRRMGNATSPRVAPWQSLSWLTAWPWQPCIIPRESKRTSKGEKAHESSPCCWFLQATFVVTLDRQERNHRISFTHHTTPGIKSIFTSGFLKTAMCVSPGKGGMRGKSTHLQSMWWSRMRKTPKARLVNLSGRVLQVELFQYIAILKVFCKIHVFHLPNGSTSWLKYA